MASARPKAGVVARRRSGVRRLIDCKPRHSAGKTSSMACTRTHSGRGLQKQSEKQGSKRAGGRTPLRAVPPPPRRSHGTLFVPQSSLPRSEPPQQAVDSGQTDDGEAPATMGPRRCKLHVQAWRERENAPRFWTQSGQVQRCLIQWLNAHNASPAVNQGS